jgi:hypothetical protein
VMDRFCMCKRNGESVDHLLLHSDVASAIWSVFSVALGCHGLCLDVLLICMIVGGPLALAAVWKMVPTCLFLCL